MRELGDDVMVCNLDHDDVTVQGEKWIRPPEPFDLVWTPVSRRLDKARKDAGIRVGDLDPNFELAFNQFENRIRDIDPILIRAVLLDLMTNILDGYREYIHFDVVSDAVRNREPVSEFEDIFDKNGFVNSKRTSHGRAMLEKIVETQNFAKFVESAAYHDSNDFIVHFFDRCVRRRRDNSPPKSPRSRLKTMLVTPPTSPTKRRLRKRFVDGPEPLEHDDDKTTYDYTYWPERMNPDRFVKARVRNSKQYYRSAINPLLIIRTRSDFTHKVNQQPALVIRNNLKQDHFYMMPDAKTRFEHTQMAMEMMAQLYSAFFLCVRFLSQYARCFK